LSRSSDLVHPTAAIHPSAHIDPSARIGPAVVIEPEVIVGPHCVIGERTRLRARSIIVTHTTLGADNDVHPYAVLGGDPQDRSYDAARPGELIVGDRNVIREGVTFSRGNWNGPATRIGSGCYFMATSHVGHNAQVGDNVTMANYSGLAGHSRIGPGCVFSGYCGVHQFVDVGEGVMFRAHASVSMHVPPFVIVGAGNFVSGLNKVGLHRNPGITKRDRDDLKEIYRAIYRDRSAASIEESLATLDGREWGPAAMRFLDFVRQAQTAQPPRKRGLCGSRRTVSRSTRLVTAEGD